MLVVIAAIVRQTIFSRLIHWLLKIQVYFDIDNKNLIITNKRNCCSQWRLTLQSETKTEAWPWRSIWQSVIVRVQTVREMSISWAIPFWLLYVCLGSTQGLQRQRCSEQRERCATDRYPNDVRCYCMWLSVVRINVCYPSNVHGLVENTWVNVQLHNDYLSKHFVCTGLVFYRNGVSTTTS